jgi:hypothetical protein
MEMEKYEVRVLLRHYWKQSFKAAATAKKKCLEYEQRPGRPRIWDSEATEEAANNSHQQVHADYHTHLALQRALFIAT